MTTTPRTPGALTSLDPPGSLCLDSTPYSQLSSLLAGFYLSFKIQLAQTSDPPLQDGGGRLAQTSAEGP